MNSYRCHWPDCGYEFEQDVKSSDTTQIVTDQVVCPRCGNGLKS